MNTKLHKRLEKAAEKNINSMANDCYIRINSLTEGSYIDGFIDGAEHGYKEAIAQAREWMKNYFPEELDGKVFEFVKLDTILADFEADMMDKLWEGEKRNQYDED